MVIPFNPELIMQVAEAGEDSVITPKEYSDILGTIAAIEVGVAMAFLIGMLMKGMMKDVTKETGIKIPIF